MREKSGRRPWRPDAQAKLLEAAFDPSAALAAVGVALDVVGAVLGLAGAHVALLLGFLARLGLLVTRRGTVVAVMSLGQNRRGKGEGAEGERGDDDFHVDLQCIGIDWLTTSRRDDVAALKRL